MKWVSDILHDYDQDLAISLVLEFLLDTSLHSP